MSGPARAGKSYLYSYGLAGNISMVGINFLTYRSTDGSGSLEMLADRKK